MKSCTKSRYRLLQTDKVQAITKNDKMQATIKKELKEIDSMLTKLYKK
jgi:hypothetical protein